MDDPVRLYLDEDTMSRDLVRALRSRSVDLLTASEAGQVHRPDRHHLDYATSLGRAVMTYNTRDFARLHAGYLAAGNHHAGIIVSDQLQVGIILRRFMRLLNVRSTVEMRDCLEYLSDWR